MKDETPVVPIRPRQYKEPRLAKACQEGRHNECLDNKCTCSHHWMEPDNAG